MVQHLESVKRHFEKMDARVRIDSWDKSDTRRGRLYDVDVQGTGRQGQEVFVLAGPADGPVEFLVLDLDRVDRHLLLMVKQTLEDGSVEKHRYLCGHDERSWFAAAVPGNGRGITSILEAKEALKPSAARLAQQRAGVREKDRHRRHNRGYLRQGEWFFIPASRLEVDPCLILHREPLRRGGGKAHVVEHALRRGGTTVYVSPQHPQGVSQTTYERLIKQDPQARGDGWRVMKRNPEVYGQGRVTHPDHATLVLRQWHRILPNTEDQAPWIHHLTFLD